MRRSKLLEKEGISLSLEVFPPKVSEKYTETAEKAKETAVDAVKKTTKRTAAKLSSEPWNFM